MVPQVAAVKWIIRMDAESIKLGKEIYDTKCTSCHDPHSSRTIVGPGYKDIMKNALFPVSKRPAPRPKI